MPARRRGRRLAAAALLGVALAAAPVAAHAALAEFVALVLYFYLLQQPQMMNQTQDIVDANLKAADADQPEAVGNLAKGSGHGDAAAAAKLRLPDAGEGAAGRGRPDSAVGARPNPAGPPRRHRRPESGPHRGGTGPPPRAPVLFGVRPGAGPLHDPRRAPERRPGRRPVARPARLHARTGGSRAGVRGPPHHARDRAGPPPAPGTDPPGRPVARLPAHLRRAQGRRPQGAGHRHRRTPARGREERARARVRGLRAPVRRSDLGRPGAQVAARCAGTGKADDGDLADADGDARATARPRTPRWCWRPCWT